MSGHRAEGEPGQERSPYLSVIICTCNRCNLVLAALASLRRQTLALRLFEVIIVDNGSEDGTLDVLQRYLQGRRQEDEGWSVRCLTEPRNGLAYARNAALEVARGEIIVFLDDDALATPRFLESLVQAYAETGADGVGGRVELYWEAPRPYWLVDELLPALGYFAPAPQRVRLPAPLAFGSSCFSVRLAALRAVGGFSPLLDKRLAVPTRLGVEDLCRRLHEAGYALWYEPRALVAHRAHAARLCRAFFLGRAYWQGRSEALLELSRSVMRHGEGSNENHPWRPLLEELQRLLRLSLCEQPLLALQRRTAAEYLCAAMEQARCWGRLHQRLSLLWEPLPQESSPSVLLVMPVPNDAVTLLLAQGLRREGLCCSVERFLPPLAWLWRQRRLCDRSRGVLHLQRPAASQLPLWRQLDLLFRLRLANYLGIPVVVADSGGWWQSARGLQAFLRRQLEVWCLRAASLILAPSQVMEDLYPEPGMQERVQALACAGFRGYYSVPMPRAEAYRRLGVPASAPFVYLCFADQHSERELLDLCEAFRSMCAALAPVPLDAAHAPQLLLAGRPADRRHPFRLLRLAARLPMLHLFLKASVEEEIPLYLGAADAVVLPCAPEARAGNVEPALLAASYGRIVVVPDLPRFHGLPGAAAVVFYQAGEARALEQALLCARTREPSLLDGEESSLEAGPGWHEYARHLRKLYAGLLE